VCSGPAVADALTIGRSRPTAELGKVTVDQPKVDVQCSTLPGRRRRAIAVPIDPRIPGPRPTVFVTDDRDDDVPVSYRYRPVDQLEITVVASSS